MENIYQKVQKIEKHYVGDDCIQIMVPYRDKITVLDENGIVLHSENNLNLYINKYLDDERRKQFPYSNIPTHFSRKGFDKISYANMILEYDKPYIRVSGGFVKESYVVRDNNNAYLFSTITETLRHMKFMTYDELMEFVGKKDGEEVYYVYVDGSIHPENRSLYPNEDKIYSHIQEKLNKNLKAFREYERTHTDSVSSYLTENPWFLNYFEQSIKNVDLSSMDFNIGLGEDPTLLIIRVKDKNITIQGLDVIFVRENKFKATICDIPVNKYTLEQLKYVAKIEKTKEPRIPLRLNPGVDKEDIEIAKKWVKRLKG